MKAKTLLPAILSAFLSMTGSILPGQSDPSTDIYAAFSNPVEIDSSDTRILFLCRSGQQLRFDKPRRVFLEEQYVSGSILGYGNVVFPATGRYRVYDDEMVIQLDGGICVLQRAAVQAVQWGGRTFVSIEYVNQRDERDLGYFELLTEGRIRLLRRLSLKGNRIREQLYLQVDGRPAECYRGGKRDLLRHMLDRLSQVESFADAEDLSWSKPADLVIIIDQYHRLRSGS